VPNTIGYYALLFSAVHEGMMTLLVCLSSYISWRDPPVHRREIRGSYPMIPTTVIRRLEAHDQPLLWS